MGDYLESGQSIEGDEAVGVSNGQVLVVGREGAIGNRATVIQLHARRKVAVVQNVHVNLNRSIGIIATVSFVVLVLIFFKNLVVGSAPDSNIRMVTVH